MYVWEIDANVSLLSGRFIVLFIVCIILFVLLLLFSFWLLLNDLFKRFTIMNKFKPLLDAYQGPYESKLSYWTGLQLVIRAVLFSISSLNSNTRLITSIIILYVISILHGLCRPFRNLANNYQ